MKSLLLVLVISLFTIDGVYAQRTGSGGFRRRGTNAQTKAMQREKLQDTLGLTEAQAKSVDAIQQEYMLKMRSVKMSTLTTDAEKKEKLNALHDQRKAELKAVISEQQLAKLDNEQPKIKKAIKNKKEYSKAKRKKKSVGKKA